MFFFFSSFSQALTHPLRATIFYKQPSSLLIDKDLKTWKSYGTYCKQGQIHDYLIACERNQRQHKKLGVNDRPTHKQAKL